MESTSVLKNHLFQTLTVFGVAIMISGLAPAETREQGRPVSDYVIDQVFGDNVLHEAQTRDTSTLKLEVLAPEDLDPVQFPILTNVFYDLAAGELQFGVDGVMTCFDYATVAPRPVRVVGVDISGFPVIDSDLFGAVAYLPLDRRLTYSNLPTMACFWEYEDDLTGERGFSLFGDFEVEDQETIFHDRLEPSTSVSIDISEVHADGNVGSMPAQGVVGQSITYRIDIENTGSRDIDNLGLQEILVNNSYAVPALLKFVEGSITCTADGGASCGALPKELELFPGDFRQLPFLRADHGDEVTLPVGSSITLELTRKIQAGLDDADNPLPPGEVTGTVIDLNLVVVDLDGIDGSPANATVRHEIEVVTED